MTHWAVKSLRVAAQLALALAGHIFVVLILVVGLAIVDHALRSWGDPKLYDLVPWRYVIETGDLFLLAVLTLAIIFIFYRRLRTEIPDYSEE